MVIRKFEDRDEREIVELWKYIFPPESPYNDPLISIHRKLEYDGNLFFVAIESNAVVGTVMGGYDGHRGWIYSLAVHPAKRYIGIGSSLVLKVENALKKLGCPKINLQIRESNREVVEFYEKLGFRVEKRISMGKIL